MAMKLELTDAQEDVLHQLMDVALRAIGTQSQKPEVRDLWDKIEAAKTPALPEPKAPKK